MKSSFSLFNLFFVVVCIWIARCLNLSYSQFIYKVHPCQNVLAIDLRYSFVSLVLSKFEQSLKTQPKVVKPSGKQPASTWITWEQWAVAEVEVASSCLWFFFFGITKAATKSLAYLCILLRCTIFKGPQIVLLSRIQGTI